MGKPITQTVYIIEAYRDLEDTSIRMFIEVFPTRSEAVSFGKTRMQENKSIDRTDIIEREL